MSPIPVPDAVLDCRGLLCPMPIAKLSERISHTPPGRVVEVIADDPDFPGDLQAYCRTTGAECLAVEDRGGETHGFVRRRVE